MYSSSLSDLKKSTVVDESLSKTSTRCSVPENTNRLQKEFMHFCVRGFTLWSPYVRGCVKPLSKEFCEAPKQGLVKPSSMGLHKSPKQGASWSSCISGNKYAALGIYTSVNVDDEVCFKKKNVISFIIIFVIWKKSDHSHHPSFFV